MSTARGYVIKRAASAGPAHFYAGCTYRGLLPLWSTLRHARIFPTAREAETVARTVVGEVYSLALAREEQQREQQESRPEAG